MRGVTTQKDRINRPGRLIKKKKSRLWCINPVQPPGRLNYIPKTPATQGSF